MEGIADVIGGRIHAMFAPATSVIPQVQAGKLKAIAVTEQQPHLACARCADHVRSGPFRLRGDDVERPVRAGRDAARGRRTARRGGDQGGRVAGPAIEDQVQWRRPDRHGRRRNSRSICRRTSADGPMRSRPPASSRNRLQHERDGEGGERIRRNLGRPSPGRGRLRARQRDVEDARRRRDPALCPSPAAWPRHSARARALGGRPHHRELRQLLSRRLPRLADAMVQGRRPIPGARAQGAGEQLSRNRGADDLHRRGLLSHRRLHASRHRPPAAGNATFDAACRRSLLGGGAAVLAALRADRNSLRRHDVASVPAPAARVCSVRPASF